MPAWAESAAARPEKRPRGLRGSHRPIDSAKHAMPHTAAKVRMVPTDHNCVGDAMRSTMADKPIACKAGTRTFQQARGDVDGKDEPRSDRRRVAPADQDKRDDPRQESDIAGFAGHTRQTQEPEQDPCGERDMEPADDQEVIHAASPIMSDHSAIELRSAPEQEGGQRAAHIRIKRVSPRARRGQPAKQPEIGRNDPREDRLSSPLNPQGALDGDPILGPGDRDVAIGGRDAFRGKMTHQLHPIASIGDARNRLFSRDEHEDVRRKPFPLPLDP